MQAEFTTFEVVSMPIERLEHAEIRKNVKFHQILAKSGKVPHFVDFFAKSVIFFEFLNTQTLFYTKISTFAEWLLQKLPFWDKMAEK